jgi:tungstate transport system ATP-binding protein
VSPPVYTIKNLKHCYNQDAVVLDIEDLTVAASRVIGLYGPNGSGKSTLLKVLGFIEKPTAGEILFNGQAVTPFSQKIRLKTVFLPQKPYLLKRSVYQNLLYGLAIRKDTHDHRNRIREALGMTGLSFDKFARRQWNDLSGGEIQRVALAARFILKPEVLLLDEPTSSLDIRSLHSIKKALLTASRGWKTTCIIASHDRNWLDEACDEVRYLFDGKLFSSDNDFKHYMRHMIPPNPDEREPEP